MHEVVLVIDGGVGECRGAVDILIVDIDTLLHAKLTKLLPKLSVAFA